jgi:hypothetical protein
LSLQSGPQHSKYVEQTVVDRVRRPIGRSYVITQGTFLIGSLGNYLIADNLGRRVIAGQGLGRVGLEPMT